MAENAAHYTVTNEAKPSIFEIIAQKSLDSTIYPAFYKITEFLAANFPNKCGSFPKYSDEAFLLLKGLLEYHYLLKRDASFSEHFYGLKRLPASTENVVSLTKSQRWLSLVILVVVPYIKRKLDNKIEQYKLQNIEGVYRNNFEKECKETVLLLYSSGEIVWKIWTLVQYMRYLSDKTEIQLPALWLIGLKLSYSQEMQDLSAFWTKFFKGKLSTSEITMGILQSGLASVLEISAFFLQFLKVWNSERRNYNITALPKIPPPPRDEKADRYKSKCPLCLQEQKIPTVLPVSGYVFCFKCILQHLKESSKCPVTNLPASATDLVRIYDGTS